MAAPVVWTVVVAAGSGRRFGGHKQFELLGDRPVLNWSLEAARSVAAGIVVAVPPERLADPLLEGLGVLVCAGGETRSASVRAGLALVPEEADIVIVHDAARPLASPALFAAVLAGLRDGVDGVVPGLPLSDTVKRLRGAQVLETLPRDELVAVQTPQAFRAVSLRAAHAEGADATDDAALLEGLGMCVEVVAGEETNLKLTSPADLERAARLVAAADR